MVTRPYDRIAKDYDSIYSAPRYDVNKRYLKDQLPSFIPPDTDVVDLGCGTGLLVDLKLVRPEHYVGVDVSAGMLAVARAKHPTARWVLADIQHCPFPTGSVSVLVSTFGATSYVEDAEALAGEVRRILALGGRAFLMFYGENSRSVPGYPFEGEVFNRFYRAEELHQLYAPCRVLGFRNDDYLVVVVGA